MNRFDLLPIWMRPFIYAFMGIALAMPVLIFINSIGYPIPIHMYGLIFDGRLSFQSISVLAIFTFKGYVAYSLWKERDGAVDLAKADALIGFVICAIMMIYGTFMQSNSHVVLFSFRFELLFLVPYIWTMNRIAFDWG